MESEEGDVVVNFLGGVDEAQMKRCLRKNSFVNFKVLISCF